MVMYGRPWTNECCMCVRSTHAEVGRIGPAGYRKTDFEAMASPPRGGFGGFEGAIFGRWRALKLRGGPNGETGRSGLGAQTGLAGGTLEPKWGHIRRPGGVPRWGSVKKREACLTGAAVWLGQGLGAQTDSWGHMALELGRVASTQGTLGRRGLSRCLWRKAFPRSNRPATKCAPIFEKCAPKCAPRLRGLGWMGLDFGGRLRC